MSRRPEPPRRALVAVVALSVAAAIGAAVAVVLYPVRVVAAYLVHPVLRLAGRVGTIQRGEWGGTEVVWDRRALERIR